MLFFDTKDDCYDHLHKVHRGYYFEGEFDFLDEGELD